MHLFITDAQSRRHNWTKQRGYRNHSHSKEAVGALLTVVHYVCTMTLRQNTIILCAVDQSIPSFSAMFFNDNHVSSRKKAAATYLMLIVPFGNHIRKQSCVTSHQLLVAAVVLSYTLISCWISSVCLPNLNQSYPQHNTLYI